MLSNDNKDICECGHARNDHDLIDATSRLRADCLVGVFRGSEVNAAICPCSWFNLADPASVIVTAIANELAKEGKDGSQAI